MRHCLILVLLWGLSGIAVWAQVEVKVEVHRDTFLAGERLEVDVKVSNFSGAELTLGQSPTWLNFIVEAAGGSVVRRLARVPVQGEFQLPNSSVATKRVNLTPYFDFTRAGRYQITASVEIPAWGESFYSPIKGFNISQGTTIWEHQVGVAVDSEEGARPEIREYSLQVFGVQSRTRLYSRVRRAANGEILNVVPLGNLVSFNSPSAQIDSVGNMHVLHQYGARLFYHTVIDSSGHRVLRNTYAYDQVRPALRLSEDQRVGVFGGVREVRLDDFPPPSRPAPSESGAGAAAKPPAESTP